MPKITIIDGNSLLFRAYFATAFPGVEIMRNQEGIPTNAIFAFSNMLNKIIGSIKEGESIFVAFDAAKHNFRHEQLETYKANRKPAPEDLVKQFPIARDFLRAFGIFQFEQEGFEGDDIAGTVAKKAAKQGYDVTIYTSDRDFLQLVDEKITVNIIKKGLSDVALMTPEMVKETYGFEPLQIIDYKGLRGDSSDNLPGIPGIGEKTAVKLINEFGSFDNIIANADKITGKAGKAIAENAELGRISRDLAIIRTDIDLPFGLEDTVYKGYSFTSINEFCQKYNLKQFMNKVSPKWKISEENVFDDVTKVTTFKGITIDDKLGIELDYVDRDDYSRGEVLGIGIYTNKKPYYINIEDAKNDDALKQILKDENIKKYAFDYKAIKVALNKNNIEINGLYFDLLIASYLLDSSIKNSPETVLYLYSVDLGSNKEDSFSLLASENPLITAKIAYYSQILAKKAEDELQKVDAINLFKNLELPLVDTLANMEIEGFPVDIKILDSLSVEYKEKISQLTEEIYSLAGEKFNISSPKQLAEILFNKLGLPDYKKGSTNVEALKDLENKHPIIGKILEYRKYFKIVSTYTEGLKPHIFSDGKIHASFNQALTQTGRLSSSNPNLQNISVRDEEGKRIRKAFYYPDENIEILSLDYSQIELRILAHLSNCKALQDVFNSGMDIHSATAKAIFKLNEEPSSNQRRKAKAVNFGIVYGISDWGLSEQIGVDVKEARNIIENFYESFPEVGQFFQNIVNSALKNGFVSTMMGRRRYLREFHESSYQAREFAKRAAMNAPIQGSAADLIKLAMINVEKAIKDHNLKSKMVLQIHDELIFMAPKEEKEILKEIVKNEMVHAMDLAVPLEVDGGFGHTWYDCK